MFFDSTLEAPGKRNFDKEYSPVRVFLPDAANIHKKNGMHPFAFENR